MNANDKFAPERLGKINASECHVLFTDTGNVTENLTQGQKTYARQLAIQLYFKFYDDVYNWRLEHGELCETSGVEYLQQYHDNTVVKLEKSDYKFIGDIGGGGDALGIKKGYDIKAPTSLKDWVAYITDGITKQQFHQGQMYMEQYNRDTWVFAAFLMETTFMANEGLQYPVDYDKRMILVEVPRLDGWIEKLNKKVPQLIELRNEYYNQLVEQFGGQKL